MFMNSTVILDNHRVWCRIGIHVVQDACNKRIKSLCTKGTFNNVTMDNSIVKRKCRQNRESEMKSAHQCLPFRPSDILSSTHKKSLPLSFGSTNRPRTTSVCSSAINGGLVNKDKLLRSVRANPRNIVETLFCRSLSCNAGELGTLEFIMC